MTNLYINVALKNRSEQLVMMSRDGIYHCKLGAEDVLAHSFLQYMRLIEKPRSLFNKTIFQFSI